MYDNTKETTMTSKKLLITGGAGFIGGAMQGAGIGGNIADFFGNSGGGFSSGGSNQVSDAMKTVYG